MAIDFFVMPFSRYVAGDYVTPAMRFAWERGVPYSIIGPAGARELPRGVPFGGVGSSERRRAILPMIDDDLRALTPTIGEIGWDERAAVEPRFHRVDPASCGALLEQARPSSHASSAIFLPCAFPNAFRMVSPFERMVGSVPAAIRELSSQSWSNDAAGARETLLAALEDARALGLPMFVDA
jgi:hypothetical protein